MPTRTLNDWLAYIEQQHPKSIAMGLERVREVATRMGLGKPAKRVIVVGGTNGKGSTVAFIEAIARAPGREVGAVPAPHLLAPRTRRRAAWGGRPHGAPPARAARPARARRRPC